MIINDTNRTMDKRIGTRLKSEAQKQGYKNTDMAKLLNYSLKYISKIYSGEVHLNDNCVEILSDSWGIRKNYIKCIDDWRTDVEMIECIGIDDRNAFNSSVQYLRSLGFDINIIYEALMEPSEVYLNWEYLKEVITDEDLTTYMSTKDFSIPYTEFLEKYVRHEVDEENLIGKQSEGWFIHFNGAPKGNTFLGDPIKNIDIGKKNLTINSDGYSLPSQNMTSSYLFVPENWVFPEDYTIKKNGKEYRIYVNKAPVQISIDVQLTYQNGLVKVLTLVEFQRFLKKLDESVSFIINTFI